MACSTAAMTNRLHLLPAELRLHIIGHAIETVHCRHIDQFSLVDFETVTKLAGVSQQTFNEVLSVLRTIIETKLSIKGSRVLRMPLTRDTDLKPRGDRYRSCCVHQAVETDAGAQVPYTMILLEFVKLMGYDNDMYLHPAHIRHIRGSDDVTPFSIKYTFLLATWRSIQRGSSLDSLRPFRNFRRVVKENAGRITNVRIRLEVIKKVIILERAVKAYTNFLQTGSQAAKFLNHESLRREWEAQIKIQALESQTEQLKKERDAKDTENMRLRPMLGHILYRLKAQQMSRQLSEEHDTAASTHDEQTAINSVKSESFLQLESAHDIGKQLMTGCDDQSSKQRKIPTGKPTMESVILHLHEELERSSHEPMASSHKEDGEDLRSDAKAITNQSHQRTTSVIGRNVQETHITVHRRTDPPDSEIPSEAPCAMESGKEVAQGRSLRNGQPSEVEEYKKWYEYRKPKRECVLVPESDMIRC